MTISSEQINVFSPRDILALSSSLEGATRRLQYQYGFNGSALDAARAIAAKAICIAAQESKRDILLLEDEGVEAVRLALISSRGVRYPRPVSTKRCYIKKSDSKVPFKTREIELLV